VGILEVIGTPKAHEFAFRQGRGQGSTRKTRNAKKKRRNSLDWMGIRPPTIALRKKKCEGVKERRTTATHVRDMSRNSPSTKGEAPAENQRQIRREKSQFSSETWRQISGEREVSETRDTRKNLRKDRIKKKDLELFLEVVRFPSSPQTKGSMVYCDKAPRRCIV